MAKAKEGAPLEEEPLDRFTIPREAREKALDRGEALLLWRELRARREREHGLELRGGELAALALNRGEERGELRGGEGGEHGRASGEGREEKGEKLLESLLELLTINSRERSGRGEALLELASVESGLTARGEGEARPGEIRGEELVRGGHRKESERTEKGRRGGRPRGLPRGRASEEAEASGSLEQSRAGGLRQRRGALASLSQSLDQQSARRGLRERLGQRSGEALEESSNRAKEGSEAASLLPEARGESMAESQREQESLERARGDRLPWQRRERLDRVRQRREGGGSRGGRSEHEKRSEGTEARRSGLDRDNKEKRRGGQRLSGPLKYFVTYVPMRLGA
jgi:hypothetical protein